VARTYTNQGREKVMIGILNLKHFLDQDLPRFLLNDKLCTGGNAMAKFEYTIDVSKNIINSEFSGFISAEAVIDYITTVRRDPDFHNGLSTICDFRQASLAAGYTEVKKVIEYVEKTSHDRGDFKLALIANLSDEESVNTFTLFSLPGYAKLCSDMSEAEAWARSDQ